MVTGYYSRSKYDFTVVYALRAESDGTLLIEGSYRNEKPVHDYTEPAIAYPNAYLVRMYVCVPAPPATSQLGN